MSEAARPSDAARIAELEAQVAELEAILERRSHELRRLQRHLGPRALANLSRIQAGKAPIAGGPFDPRAWRESTAMTAAHALPLLRQLWEETADG